MKSLADLFCETVANDPDMPHAAARFGAWLIGAAAQTGGFPLEVTVHQITQGFEREGVKIPGMGGRYGTIRDSVQWLKDKGCLAADKGQGVGFGHHALLLSITL